MTDTTISDAVVFGQDDGTGVSDGSEDFMSAAGFQLLAKYKGDGTYVGEDQSGNATLQFNDVDTTNEEVDVGTGYAYIMDGGHTVQSGAQDVYDTTLPVNSPYVVILPSEVTNLGLDSGTNDVWLALDPTQNDSVFLRHGSGLSAPSEPSVKLGTVDASSGATTRPSDLAASTHRLLDTEQATIGSGDTINQFEFGEASIDPGPASDDSTTTSAEATVSVSFSTEFTSAPRVIVGFESDTNQLVTAHAGSITTTGFSLTVRNWTSIDTGSKIVAWAAVE